MPDLYGIPLKILRRDITDEVMVAFFDKATKVVYQEGGIMVARAATEKEIVAAISRRCAELEAEAATVPADPPVPIEIALPPAVINTAFDRDGEIKV